MLKIEDIKNTIINGECLSVMREMPDNSVDSIITDPPAGISFMGKAWDDDKGGRDKWIMWLTEVMVECYRVAKPGATALVWALPRTSHWTATAIENAGWFIKDIIMHIFGSGFPKSLDIGKQIDKMQGNERKVVGVSKNEKDFRDVGEKVKEIEGIDKLSFGLIQNAKRKELEISKGKTIWEGYGTSLKPAAEHWILAMKPNEGNYAENALKHGVAGLNIDGGRIPINKEKEIDNRVGTDRVRGDKRGLKSKSIFDCTEKGVQMYKEKGRYPANLILECTCDETKEGKEEKVSVHDAPKGTFAGGEQNRGSIKNYRERKVGKTVIHTNPDCPCRILDEQSGNSKSIDAIRHNNQSKFSGKGIYGKYQDKNTIGFNDIGGASRFFKNIPAPKRFLYQSKASKAERNMGCEGLKKGKSVRWNKAGKWTNDTTPAKNDHPTVKSLALMQYLCTLTKTPTGGIVLDPFAGSGTTGIACKKIGRDYILIEREPEYFEIAKARLKAQMKPLF